LSLIRFFDQFVYFGHAIKFYENNLNIIDMHFINFSTSRDMPITNRILSMLYI